MHSQLLSVILSLNRKNFKCTLFHFRYIYTMHIMTMLCILYFYLKGPRKYYGKYIQFHWLLKVCFPTSLFCSNPYNLVLQKQTHVHIYSLTPLCSHYNNMPHKLSCDMSGLLIDILWHSCILSIIIEIYGMILYGIINFKDMY